MGSLGKKTMINLLCVHRCRKLKTKMVVSVWARITEKGFVIEGTGLKLWLKMGYALDT